MGVDFQLSEVKIGIIGLGYVGLPLAVEFSHYFPVIGFDLDQERIEQLKNGFDKKLEISSSLLVDNSSLFLTSEAKDLSTCNVYIITVPTPIDNFKQPDLRFLKQASLLIGSLLKPKDVVIYESTVFPTCTEEECVPILSEASGLCYNTEFFCGYSPERINPGDKNRKLSDIIKITAGSTPEVAEFVDAIYAQIIKAGTFKAKSIKVAEAAKAIENAQRDVNISFMNELALIFDKLGINTHDVLEAAATKWNFQKFTPGLVGGHCISVDPYYLVYKAQSLGYFPKVISSGRHINEGMGVFVANKLMKTLIARGFVLQQCRVLILGFAYKENCTDIRNTKVADICQELNDFGVRVFVYDPCIYIEDAQKEYPTIDFIQKISFQKYDGIVVAVAHQAFYDIKIDNLKQDNRSVVFDVKGFVKNADIYL